MNRGASEVRQGSQPAQFVSISAYTSAVMAAALCRLRAFTSLAVLSCAAAAAMVAAAAMGASSYDT